MSNGSIFMSKVCMEEKMFPNIQEEDTLLWPLFLCAFSQETIQKLQGRSIIKMKGETLYFECLQTEEKKYC